jgi:hypothetical protein
VLVPQPQELLAHRAQVRHQCRRGRVVAAPGHGHAQLRDEVATDGLLVLRRVQDRPTPPARAEPAPEHVPLPCGQTGHEVEQGRVQRVLRRHGAQVVGDERRERRRHRPHHREQPRIGGSIRFHRHGIGVPGQEVQVGPFVRVQPQRAHQPGEDGGRRLRATALLQPLVVDRRHVRQARHLVPAQSRCAAPLTGPQPHHLRCHRVAALAQEIGQRFPCDRLGLLPHCSHRLAQATNTPTRPWDGLSLK